MPFGVMALLVCWRNGLGRSNNLEIGGYFVFWCIWGERNSRCFEGKERNLLELNGSQGVASCGTAGLVPQSSTIEFLDFCNP